MCHFRIMSNLDIICLRKLYKDNVTYCLEKKNSKLRNLLDENIQKILRVAVESRTNAYCPYSNFQVGAAVLCKDGSVYGGCNIENVSFTVGTCAERVAYGKAISEGKREFTAVAVIANYEFTTPCGACRQYINELGKVNVYIGTPSLEKIMVTHIDDLLPFAFDPSNKPF